jgi:hypothetical protein
MREWERPIMRELAREVTKTHGEVLEVGFGMAISATYIMEFGSSRYTVIEPHPAVIEAAKVWAKRQPAPVEIVTGFWQDELDRLGKFDGILFDTFPLTKEEEGNNLILPFISAAREHLNSNGVFTCYSGAAATISAKTLKLLLDTFEEVRLFKVKGLRPPRGSPFWSSGSLSRIASKPSWFCGESGALPNPAIRVVCTLRPVSSFFRVTPRVAADRAVDDLTRPAPGSCGPLRSRACSCPFDGSGRASAERLSPNY